MEPFDIIAAVDRNNGIGFNGKLPWKILSDLKHFRKMTENSAIIMGRKTWESLGKKPLKNRYNIIVTRSAGNAIVRLQHNIIMIRSLIGAIDVAHEICDRVFVIGGAEIYTQALVLPGLRYIYITRIEEEYDVDTYFPNINIFDYKVISQKWVHNDGEPPLQFITLSPNISYQNSEECQYLNLISKIMESGVPKDNTITLFGAQMRFNLVDQFPLLTTKRVFWRGVVEELLWFLRGETNSNTLANKGVHIWDANGTREFLDSKGLVFNEEGDLGPIYGFQFRHFGATYIDCHTDYSNQGVDQLQNLINEIKTNPTSRHLIMSAWNPAMLNQMALPPCHMFCQFFVNGKELSCHMYQRSCDMGIGVPFNIASYSLLTYLVAHVCDLDPKEFIHTLGDTHIYIKHIEPLKEQLLRTPLPFPKLHIKRKVNNIDEFQFEDFELENYNPHPTIKMKLITSKTQ